MGTTSATITPLQRQQAVSDLMNILADAEMYDDSDANVVEIKKSSEGVLKVGIKTDGDKAYKFGPRSKSQKAANKSSRDLFMQTLTMVCDGGIPDVILNDKEMKLSDFNADGKPLTARRLKKIGAVLCAKLGEGFANKLEEYITVRHQAGSVPSGKAKADSRVVKCLDATKGLKPVSTATHYLGNGGSEALDLTSALFKGQGLHQTETRNLANLFKKLLACPKDLETVMKSQLEKKRTAGELSGKIPEAYQHGDPRTVDELLAEFDEHSENVWAGWKDGLGQQMRNIDEDSVKKVFDEVSAYIRDMISENFAVFTPEAKAYEAIDQAYEKYRDHLM